MDTRFNAGLLGLAAVLSLGTASVAHAQVQFSASQLPPGVPHPGGVLSAPQAGVTAVAPPPAGFNVLSATAEERAKYAIPPAPDKNSRPQAYAAWEKAVAIPFSQTNRPVAAAPAIIQKTQVKHGPAKGLTKVPGSGTGQGVANGTSNAIVTTTSTNWSGTVVVIPSKPFAIGAVGGVITVPSAHQPLNACSGGWLYSSAWPGIDGWNSNDVFQAGIEADSYCSAGTTASYYSAWIEWYPDYSYSVSQPAVSPGDMIYVQVWNDTSTHGYAYFHNYTTGVSATYILNAPAGTTLVGNSAEWIVEAPTVNGGQSALMNYVFSDITLGQAWNYKAASVTYWQPGADPATVNPSLGGTLEYVQMVNSSKTVISTPYVESVYYMRFQNSGPSYQMPAAGTSASAASSAFIASSPY